MNDVLRTAEKIDRLADRIAHRMLGTEGTEVQVFANGDPGYRRYIGAPITRDSILTLLRRELMAAEIGGGEAEDARVLALMCMDEETAERVEAIRNILSWEVGK